MASYQEVDLNELDSCGLEIDFLDFRELLQTGNSSDCTIVCGGEEIRAHKLLLIRHSQYFARLFASNWKKENQENRVELDDVDPAEMKLLLDLFYSGASRTWTYPSSDIALNVRLWILADRFIVVLAQQVITKNLIKLLEETEEKRKASDPEILDMVFSHPACAKSMMGFIFGESACYVDQFLNCDWEYTSKIQALQSRHGMLGQTMYEWSKTYAPCTEQILSDSCEFKEVGLRNIAILDKIIHGEISWTQHH